MIKILSRNWVWALAHPVRSARFARACVATFPTNSQERQK